MAIDRVVVNASPLIALMGIGQEGLLPGLFKEVIVPAGVMEGVRLPMLHAALRPSMWANLWLNRVFGNDRCKGRIRPKADISVWRSS